MKNKVKRSRGRKPRKPQEKIDSAEWRVPLDPPETTNSVFPFTVQGPPSMYNMSSSKGQAGGITYDNVADAIRESYGIRANSSNLAVRIDRYAVYGRTSTTETTTAPSNQHKFWLEDAYTGRVVQGVSTPVKRARAGIVQNGYRQMFWYNGANLDTIPSKDLFYIRIGETNTGCVNLTNQDNAYDIVVRGYCRLAKPIPNCG